MIGERLQQTQQSTGYVFGRYQQGCFIVTTGTDILLTDNDEASGIVGHILDVLEADLQSEDFHRGQPADGSGVILGGSKPGRLGIATDRNTFGARQVLIEPATTLREGLLVRVNMFDSRDILQLRCQVMVYGNLNLTANLQTLIDKHIEGVTDDALR